MGGDWAKQSRIDATYCPNLPGGGHRVNRMMQGRADALQLAADIRDVDLAVVWGRLNRWRHQDPARLLTACVTLAAMTPEDPTGLLDWTEEIGGLAGLQPPPKIPQMRGENAA